MRYLSLPKYQALYAKVFLEPLICVIISVRFKFQWYSLLSIERIFPCLFLHFFYINFRKSCALFIEFLFSHDIFLQGKFLPHSPLHSNPPPKPKKNPLKTTVYFPITIIICKYWSKFVTCSPYPRDCGGVSHSQRHSYYGFWLCGTKWLSQNFDLLTLEKKWAWEGA